MWELCRQCVAAIGPAAESSLQTVWLLGDGPSALPLVAAVVGAGAVLGSIRLLREELI